jgi:hypothetical protein
MLKNPISCLLGIAMLISCSPKNLPLHAAKVKRLKTNELLANIDSLSSVSIDFFYAKMSTKFQDTNRSLSFKTSIRLKADSAFSALISYASIPVASALVTKDSLTIVNKREKCYIQNNLAFFRENFGVDFNFENIQELLLGIPLDYDTTQKYFQIHEPYRYVVSSHRKRFIKRIDKKEDVDRDIVVQYYLSDNAKQLDGLEIISLTDTASIYVRYLSRQEVNGFQIPREIEMEVFTPRNHLKMEMTYIKTEINDPQPLYFILPESYEVCP